MFVLGPFGFVVIYVLFSFCFVLVPSGIVIGLSCCVLCWVRVLCVCVKYCVSVQNVIPVGVEPGPFVLFRFLFVLHANASP